MVILHTETLRNWGGQQNRVLTEAVELGRRGHRMVIACRAGSMLAEKARAADVSVYELNMVKQAQPLTVARLVRIVRREKIDLVATHSSVDSWAGGIAAKMTGRRLVRFKHNLYPVRQDPLSRLIYAAPDLFITVNRSAAAVLRNAGHVQAGRVRVVYGAIDTVRYDPARVSEGERKALRRSLGIPDRALVIGNTSGFTKVKGQRYLVEAMNVLFRKRPELILLLVGGGLGSRERVLDLLSPAYRSRVILPGHRSDIPQLLSLMDVFVFPSTSEAFGNSLIEAMAMARPVVVSDLESFREFMTDGDDGIFFRTGHADDLARTLIPCLENEEIRIRLGARARITVQEHFTVERMIDVTEALYRDLLCGRLPAGTEP